MEEKGLGEIWRDVVEAIEDLAVAGCYEKVNNTVSLGLLGRLRRRAAEMAGGRVILDAGSGPGTSTRVIAQVHPRSSIIMLDPSAPMLNIAHSQHASSRVLAVLGRFEALPLASGSVDSIVAMFSFRDAVSYGMAAREFARVLRPDGRVVILDFYKPLLPARLLLKLYLMVSVPLALLLARCAGKLGLYRGFLHSIDRMLTLDEMRELFGGLFEVFRVYRTAPGVAIFYAERPTSRPPS